ncbi:TetR/AcrR family transcriptional regulator [Fimbriimonas ginsengisoli]|uniref:TetR family transcriptional regulator n=1 Tax=Fimbriimonas ginsengisoli Gsoil 348 TaxID=661478 RepID=A0A068NM85_FIMGI|nr:TetR/AcrR family transcriptional regulator [Fimbriimonas ginsengisoli]AIE84527.1 TetR family transcriptional regulator [Fimbriimonas ginsengisoli Gsoil 348]
MKKSKPPAKLGRPRAFDADEALDRALEVFWRSGYEGASLSDLTEAMGITRPSLYAAFGNKEELFRKALDRYMERADGVTSALEEPSARVAIETFLTRAVSGQCGQGKSRGCLLVQGALSCSEASEHVRKELAERRGQAEAAIRKRLIRAKEEGGLPADTDPADLARYYATVSHGLSVQAASGTTPEELLKVVEAAMRAWPENSNVGERR